MFSLEFNKFQLWHLFPPLPYLTEITALKHLNHLFWNLSHRVRLAVPVTVVPQGLALEVKETSALVELPIGSPPVDVDVSDRQLASEVVADVLLGFLLLFAVQHTVPIALDELLGLPVVPVQELRYILS